MFGDSFFGELMRGASSTNDECKRGESCIMMLSCDSSTNGSSLMEELASPKRTLLSFLLVTMNCEGVSLVPSSFGVTIFDGEVLDRIVEGLGPPMLKLGCSSLMIDSSMESSTLSFVLPFILQLMNLLK